MKEISLIPIGKMFLYFNPTTMDKPQVWVKVATISDYGDEFSAFVNNDALVRQSINPNNPRAIGRSDKWYIGDKYYGEMVRKGEFIPISDLRDCDDICVQSGWPLYEIDFGF